MEIFYLTLFKLKSKHLNTYMSLLSVILIFHTNLKDGYLSERVEYLIFTFDELNNIRDSN